MKNVILTSLIVFSILALGSCSKNNDDNSNPTNNSQPVETNAANTNYTPAFQGQTRIGSVQATSAYQADILTTALTSPWGITALSDGRLLVTQKAGSMRIVTNEGVVSNPIGGIPAVNAAGQGGLLGLCIDPQFTTNRMVYWVFSEVVSGGNVASVAKGRLSNDETTIESATVIYRANPARSSSAHYGGRILFDQTGNLMVSTGEGSDISTRPLAQSVTVALGKIIRITTNGQAATGNPTFSQPGALPELFSIGHRNPQGMAIHPITGDFWQSEHGPRGGDEINRLTAGQNFGWPIISYGIEYGGQPIGEGIQQQEGLQQPVYYWDPVISPSGMTFYTSNRIPEWQNNLFIGALSGMHIVRLVIENNLVTGEERLLADQNQRFRDITQGTDGALYTITDQGRLYRIDRQ
ncbi:PQQ-dependent sugar dehydrogenase [Flavobacterium piscis]|uniref:Glucose/arabinose dehydrogenase n=1 Tax=Flavobacterium piscis TaxID=1114874 RepID=A0ABU1Y7U3_9FLAO|nr:PQQ-dependent sugar dehydrogenase [Flavobacterium piscis]MDR7210304.1 glucose/arabinose dehydrogenase [Flavobacterium piscis]